MVKKSTKVTGAAPKPRDPFVQHLINRKGAGVHMKTFKAHRAAEKANLKRAIHDT